MDVFHEGELQVQELTGEAVIASQNAKMISSRFSKGIIQFLKSQRFIVLSSTDQKGNVWVTFFVGQPGFAEVVDDQLLTIRAEPIEGDPVALKLGDEQSIGLLIIDTNRRIRLRINGRAAVQKNQLVVTADQIYGNCPKYIQKRSLDPEKDAFRLVKSEQRTQELTKQQQEWISQADTFYIGSVNENGAMDASHRGGNPGFIQVVNEKTILFPDYFGNSMFNTLGNIYSNPLSGLLFIDYDHGHSLHLTGSSQIIWDTAVLPGAGRLVRFEIGEIVQVENATSLKWGESELSPFNPRG